MVPGITMKSVPESQNRGVFTTIQKKGLCHVTEMVFSPHRTPVPESLNRAVFTTFRKSLGLCHVTRMPHGFWSQNKWTLQFSSPYRKRAYVTWLRWCSVHTDTSPRVTEPCSFHHLQKKAMVCVTWLRCPTDSGPRINEPCSFHHHTERGFMSRDLDGVQSTLIPVPESLNCTVFTTYRKRACVTDGTWSPRGF